MEPILVIMAAGMGSRYGGNKQLDQITEQGDIIMDFSLYDAYEAGFTAKDASILIVDDNALNIRVERKLLEATKVHSDTALSGAEALGKTLRTQYDVILMDHLMPEMDGIECLAKIREQAGGLNKDTPVIALTANAGSENQELYRASGFDDYLCKPVSGSKLEEMIMKHIKNTRCTTGFYKQVIYRLSKFFNIQRNGVVCEHSKGFFKLLIFFLK